MKRSVAERIRSLFHNGEAAPSQQHPTVVEPLRLLECRKALLQNMCELPEKNVLPVLREFDAALGRISQGDYGRCATCDQQISWATLLLNPVARHCDAHRTSDEQDRVSQDNRIASLLVISPLYPFKRRRTVIGRGGMGVVYRDEPVSAASLEEMVKDTVLASVLQSSLLPQRGLRLGPWETSYAYAPARTVSGDYCDLIADIGSDQLFFCFGDGMGKGIVGSIISSLLHSLFRTLVTFRHEETLTTLVERANRVLCEEFCKLELGYYATVIFGRALHNGALELVNAGHPPAFLVGSGEVVPLKATGLPLGLFYTSTYESTKVLLAEGEALLMYTDGVTEAEDRSGAEYGHERLAHVAEQHEFLSAEELVGACVQDVTAFTSDGPLSDDRTIMVVRRI